MKRINFMRGAAIAFVAVFSIGAAQAATISGALNFGGQTVPTGGTGLADATGLSFPSGFFATFANGDLSGINPGDTGSISNFTFSGLPVSLLSIAGFSYTLNEVNVIDQSAQFLKLEGSGTLSGAGFDDTPYLFSMSVDTAGGGVAFSGTLTAVPIPGALILFMSGIAALGMRRRD